MSDKFLALAWGVVQEAAMNRRDLLKAGLYGGAVSLLPAMNFTSASNLRSDRPPIRAHNVIFFAYDGLTWEDVATGVYFAHRHQNGRTLALERLIRNNPSGCMYSHSLTSVVTDSAAASAAWATGCKIVNEAVSVYPDGTELTTILQLARDTGRATGLVTTTRITHATPAAWIAHVPHRSMEDLIAEHYLKFMPDVLMGGGARHFDPSARTDRRDLRAAFVDRGYTLLNRDADLDRANGSRLLGLFHDNHLPYEIDRRFQNAQAPSLARMVRKALTVLQDHEKGFVLQIEAGRIDHANHANDPGAMVWDLLAADEALSEVMDFVDANPHTLLIFAADHGTGSGAVFGAGTGYRQSSLGLSYLTRRRASTEHMLKVLGKTPDAQAVSDVAWDCAGVKMSLSEARKLAQTIAQGGYGPHPTAHGEQPYNALHLALTSGDKLHPDRLTISYATGAHTAGPVPYAVYGAGSEHLPRGLVDNTDMFVWMTEALRIDYRNPPLTEAAALRHLSEDQLLESSDSAPLVAP